MQKIVIATKNPGKVREMAAALSALPVEVVSLAEFGQLPDAVEDGKTFAENARIKAAFYRQQTGCACIADDSGLEIEVLGGAPGIHSARFAGFHADDATNNAKMVEELQRLGVSESAADYRCAIAFVGLDGMELAADGRCDGQIKLAPKGENGFGYDPYFYPQEYPGRTMAELTLEEKQRISHRGKALKALSRELEARLK
ncbi:XTP/dITP diphosphohydrolase [Selenomonas sp. GACV-9]|uniref:RdgB/HAM1 family non-canonical purine NTP pyrophosphatase n=1 Tax=Selenomonas sp. GACV-9 TaxID=3158782 RepID=UPI0008F25311|nr:XTP/dITP diphosphohydrolase [Selenomonas ruminantium]